MVANSWKSWSVEPTSSSSSLRVSVSADDAWTGVNAANLLLAQGGVVALSIQRASFVSLWIQSGCFGLICKSHPKIRHSRLHQSAGNLSKNSPHYDKISPYDFQQNINNNLALKNLSLFFKWCNSQQSPGVQWLHLLCSDIGPLRRIFEKLPPQLYRLPCLPKINRKKSTSSPLMIQNSTPHS